jgi:hypothetical protein
MSRTRGSTATNTSCRWRVHCDAIDGSTVSGIGERGGKGARAAYREVLTAMATRRSSKGKSLPRDVNQAVLVRHPSKRSGDDRRASLCPTVLDTSGPRMVG